MFPSQQLISYVFANPDDEYRCNDLLTLNLKQYLWKSLHQQYHTVYFLDSSDHCTFTVHTLGDRDAVLPDVPKRKQSYQAVFGSWLLNQLCRDYRNAAAIVCPLDLFCQILSQEAWRPLLEQLADLSWPRRTGILVLAASPYAEDSREYLMNSPVFDWLRETAVTTSRGRYRCIYSDLRDKKPEHYRCLNAFTPDRLDDLLLHICAGNTDRCLAPAERKELARRLAAYLQLGQPLPGVSSTATPVLYLTYRELYGQLLRPEVWAGIQELPHRTRLTQPRPILRRWDSYAGRCLTLRLPGWALDGVDTRNRSSEDILDKIREIVALPSNHPKNPELTNAALKFLDELYNLRDGDIDTATLLLDALKFCVDQMNRWEAQYFQSIRYTVAEYRYFAQRSDRLFEFRQALSNRRQALSGREKDAANDIISKDYEKWKESREALNGCLFFLQMRDVNPQKDIVYKDLREKYDHAESAFL